MENMKNEDVKVWIYCRSEYSSTKMDEQEQRLVAFAKKNGWQIAGISKEMDQGKDVERIALQNLHRMNENSEIHLLLVTSRDRIAIQLSDVKKFMRRFERFMGTCFSLKEGLLILDN